MSDTDTIVADGLPQKISISGPSTEGKFRLSLHFPEGRTPSAIEIEMTPEILVGLIAALQKVQARHQIPTPPNLRRRGKPILKVVVDRDDPNR